MLVTLGLLDESETPPPEPKYDQNEDRVRNLSRFERMSGTGKGEKK